MVERGELPLPLQSLDWAKENSSTSRDVVRAARGTDIPAKQPEF